MIGKLIYSYRKEYGITQDALVEVLSSFSPNLKKLNTVTLSRWERGITSPSIAKKRDLLRFIVGSNNVKKSNVYMLIKEQYRLLVDATLSALPGANSLLLGNLPIFDNNENCIHTLNDPDMKNTFLEHIIDIEQATHPSGYCKLSHDRMGKYLQTSSTFAILCTQNKQYLGHFIMLKIKSETAVAIANNQKSKYDILHEELCSIEEAGSYIIQAVYASNPQYAMLLKTEAYLFLLDNMDTVKDLVIFSTRTDGATMSKNYGIRQVAEGKDEKYGFKWFGMLSPIEDVLFSDTVVKLIF